MNLTSGRTEPCLDNIGGIRTIWLFAFVDYDFTQVLGVRGSTVTSFPATDIYEFETRNANMSETSTNDENGVSFDQSLTFTLKQQDLRTLRDLHTLEKLDLRYIVKMNDGKLKIGGLWKGARLSFEAVSGGSLRDLIGYNITIKGKEEYPSAFLSNLNDFTQIQYLLLEDGDPFLLESAEFLILE
jgi:hypothetical protein